MKKLNLKIGDNVYCIKSIVHDNILYYSKNKTYKISDAKSDINNKYQLINILNELKEGYSWEFNILCQELNVYRFSDHFITQQQYRKLKLQKIHENRR